jgi:hypothetical protein
MLEPAIDEIDTIIENGVAEIYRGFYRLRVSEQYQREYDEMGALLNMLMEDRDYLRKNKGVV